MFHGIWFSSLFSACTHSLHSLTHNNLYLLLDNSPHLLLSISHGYLAILQVDHTQQLSVLVLLPWTCSFVFFHLLRIPPDSLLPTPNSECVSCSALCNFMGCSSPGSSVHRILQARILEWITISFSWGTSLPRDWTQVSCIAGRSLSVWATRESPNTEGHSKYQNISWTIKLIP